MRSPAHARRLHGELKGKTEIALKHRIDTRDDLAAVYTPDVGIISADIGRDPEAVWTMTGRGNTVAVISDGSAILGLGDLGPEAALPVMEGKCALFKRFANIDAVPLVLSAREPDEIVRIVTALAPGFGGINLEDISAPRCFEIEERLKNALDIPVMHDDQHGTAIVALAGLLNAAQVTGRRLEHARIVVNGVGAAGVAIMRLINRYAGSRIFAVDSKGVVGHGRDDLNEEKRRLLDEGVIVGGVQGGLRDALKGADIFIGVSKANLLDESHLAVMKSNPIIFALANPVPEIMPDVARGAGAAVVATGRSDFPNQINNVLAYPGVFRGALDARLPRITDDMKTAAAEALAALIESPTAELIVPDVFDPRVVPAVAKAVGGR